MRAASVDKCVDMCVDTFLDTLRDMTVESYVLGLLRGCADTVRVFRVDDRLAAQAGRVRESMSVLIKSHGASGWGFPHCFTACP